MELALRILAVVIGVPLIGLTIRSALRSTVLPRDAGRGIARLTLSLVWGIFRLRAKRRPDYEGRDTVMAMFGPVSLLALLLVWLLLVMIGFGLIYMGIGKLSLQAAVELSGSSTFTLGTTSSHRLSLDWFEYLQAACGLLLVTLLITYLPSIYSAYNRREIGVNLMRSRGGRPPHCVKLLIRYQRIGGADELHALWVMWEQWFLDVEETHTTFTALGFFRSPSPSESWVVSAGTVLDAAGMSLAVLDIPRDPEAALCLRSGFLALRQIASVYGLAFDEDPRPSDPISISRAEWDVAVDKMAAAGVPIRQDREEAWLAWRGWRVNYDTALLALARAVEAPPVDWVSDRTPVAYGQTSSRWHLFSRGQLASEEDPDNSDEDVNA